MSTTLFDTQFGINIGPWENQDLVTCLTKLTRLGYNGIEVTNKTFASFGDRVQVLQEITHDVGIEVISYVLKMDFDKVAKDSTLLDHFQLLSTFIKDLNGSYVIIEQGLPAKWNANKEDELAHFEKVVTDFSGICSDNGIELVFHPTPDSFILQPEIMDRVVELIYPLGCRICFDICDFMLMGIHPIQFMKKYFEAIRVIHMNDMKILKGKKAWMLNLPEKTILGQGRVDLKSIWLFLQAMEYKGWVITECPPNTSLSKGIDLTTRHMTKELEVFLTNTL